MSLTPEQNTLYTDLLFKKVATGKSTSDPDKPYFEEPVNGRSFVELSQIWAQSDQIPNVAAEVPGVVVKLVKVPLIGITGYDLSFWFGVKKSIIPFNFGNGTSYVYSIETESDDPIFSGTNEWYLDPDTGVLTFLAGLGGLPGISHAHPPKITCYEYIGLTANDTGLGGGGGGGGGSIGEWQDSVLGFSDSLSSPSAGTSGLTIDLYADPALTSFRTQIPISNGTRFIHVGTQMNDQDIYDEENDETNLGPILPNVILTWWDATVNGTTNGGWIVYNPTTGTFSSVDLSNNSIVRYTGSVWITQYFEKTIPREMRLIPEESLADINDWQVLSNTKIIDYPSIEDTELHVNNVRTVEIGATPAYAFGTTFPTDVSAQIANGTNTTFESVGVSGTNGTSGTAAGFYIGQVLQVTVPAYGLVNVVDITGNIVTVSSDVGNPITGVSTVSINIAANILEAISNASGVLDNITIFWNSVNAGYYIENDDDLIFNYNVIEN